VRENNEELIGARGNNEELIGARENNEELIGARENNGELVGHASSLLAEAESGPADCNTSASARYHVTGRGEIMDKFIGHLRC